MNDPRDPFELELKARLGVDPSPGLQSRIRARAFAAPERRIPWFTLSAGFATAAIAVVFAVLYFQHQPAAVPPAQAPITRTVTPPASVPAPITEKEAAVPKQSKPAAIPVERPIGIATAFTIIPLESDQIESPSLNELELTDALRPIPPASIPSIARLEPITLEPLALTVRTLGVNQ